MSRVSSRLLVTAALPVVVWLAGFVTLPGVDSGVLRSLMRAAPTSGAWSSVSVLALGIVPALSAFLIVEVIAALVPRWRRLRAGGPDGRPELRRAALVATIAIAFVQGWFVALWLEGNDRAYGFFGVLVHDPGLGFRFVVAATLLGGTCFLLALAWLVDRHGLANGFSALLACARVPPAIRLGDYLFSAVGDERATGQDLAATVFKLGVMAFGSWWLLTAQRRRPASPRQPVSGYLPILLAASLLELPARLAYWGLAIGPLAEALSPRSTAYLVSTLALTALGCAGFALAFYRRERRGPELGRAIFFCGAVLCALVLTASRIDHPPSGIDAALVLLASALALDLAAEWRARSAHGELDSAWQLHEVVAADAAVATLAAAGIPALARGVHHRALLRFFGPYLPIEILVPASRVDDARALLTR